MDVLHVVQYKNRKIYSKTHAKYLKLSDIFQFCIDGVICKVQEYETKKDITNKILFKSILISDSDEDIKVELLQKLYKRA